MQMLSHTAPVVHPETRPEFFARLAHQDAAEHARIEATYPLLVETRVADVPRSEKALLDAVAAFLEGLFLGRNCELRLTDLDAVADAMATRWDDECPESLATAHGDMLRELAEAWEIQSEEIESRLARRLAELGDDYPAIDPNADGPSYNDPMDEPRRR